LKSGLAHFLDHFEPELYRSAHLHTVPVRWRVADRVSEEQAAELVARYQTGESSRDLAAAFGIGKTAVMRLLRTHGVQIRPRCATRRLSCSIVSCLPRQVLNLGDDYLAEVRLWVHD
jgi:hypothetical protein